MRKLPRTSRDIKLGIFHGEIGTGNPNTENDESKDIKHTDITDLINLLYQDGIGHRNIDVGRLYHDYTYMTIGILNPSWSAMEMVAGTIQQVVGDRNWFKINITAHHNENRILVIFYRREKITTDDPPYSR